MSFRISGVAPEKFSHLFGLPDEELKKHLAKRVTVNGTGFPERIEMRDAESGEVLLLVNYEHQPADTPYRSRHAIYVREGATNAYSSVDTIPKVLASRLLSLRAFNSKHMMVDADVVEGVSAAAAIERMLANPRIEYIQAHYAKPGCFAAQIVRA
jgi:hypothetical protein